MSSDNAHDETVDFIPVLDPLLRNPRLEYAVTLPVLGITTRFESNSRHVIQTVEQSFGKWRAIGELAASDPFVLDPLCVRIVVQEGVESMPHPVPVRHIAPDDVRVIAQSPASIAISDPARRESIAYVTTDLAGHRDHFRGALLEATTLALLAHFDRHPVHAAAIARHGHAVLLAGASGAGKSTLAHLAHSAGIDVMSEDRVWIQHEPSLHVWGWPGHARLLIDGQSEKREVALASCGRSSCYVADSAAVCVLARGPVASLERISSSEVLEELVRDVALGFDRFPARHSACARTLAAGGGWRLTLSNDPRHALPFLERMLGEHLV
jgi:hypothetical protein